MDENLTDEKPLTARPIGRYMSSSSIGRAQEERMSIVFEFRRHSIKDGPARGMIGPRGWMLAREVGRRQLRGKDFTHFFGSTLWRTHQTLAAFDEGAGDFRFKRTPEHAAFYADLPGLMELWKACAIGAKRGIDMMQTALSHDPELADRTAKACAEKFREWLPSFPEDSRVLVVGHSPNMELLALGMTGLILPGLSECRGFRLALGDGGARLESDSPDLDPSGIRHEIFDGSS